MDPRARRTVRALRRALLDCLLESRRPRASVREVCARARVGRSTFYTHFADVEDLLLSGFCDLEQELSAYAQSRLAFGAPLIQHVRIH